jgi:hypothetical protein
VYWSQLSMSKVISFCIACVYGTVLYFGRRNINHGATMTFLPVAFFGLAYIWFGDRIRPWKKRYFDVLYPWPTGKSFEYWPKFIGWVLLIVPFVLTLLMLLEVI